MPVVISRTEKASEMKPGAAKYCQEELTPLNLPRFVAARPLHTSLPGFDGLRGIAANVTE